jgi:predicted Zn-dependent protease
MTLLSHTEPACLYEAIDLFIKQCTINNLEGDIIVEDTKRLSFKIDSENYYSEKIAHEICCSIRIISNGNSGYSYIQSIDRDHLKIAINSAISSLSSEKALTTSPYHEYPLSIINKDTHHSIDEDNIQLTLDDLDTTNSDTLCPSRGKSITSVHRIFQATSGAIIDKIEKSYLYFTSACEAKNRRYITSEVEFFSKKENQASDIAKKCINKHIISKNKINSASLKKYDLIFSPSVIGELLNCNNYFFLPSDQTIERVDEINWDNRINLYEVSGFDGSLIKNEIDFEGTPKSDTCILEKGKLKQILHNRQTASDHFTYSTGNAIRPMRGKIGVGSSLFLFDTGDETNSQLYQGEYLYIVSIKGQYGLINGSGNILCEGYLMSNNEAIASFSDFQFYLNFFELFSNIAGVGNQQFTSKQKDLQTPEIRISSNN